MVFKLLMSIMLMCSSSLIATAESLKILGLFPHPAISHFHVFHPIMRGLADAGHDVTVVSHFPDENAPANYKDLHLPSTDSLTNAIDLEVYVPVIEVTLCFKMLRLNIFLSVFVVNKI